MSHIKYLKELNKTDDIFFNNGIDSIRLVFGYGNEVNAIEVYSFINYPKKEDWRKIIEANIARKSIGVMPILPEFIQNEYPHEYCALCGMKEYDYSFEDKCGVCHDCYSFYMNANYKHINTIPTSIAKYDRTRRNIMTIYDDTQIQIWAKTRSEYGFNIYEEYNIFPMEESDIASYKAIYHEVIRRKLAKKVASFDKCDLFYENRDVKKELYSILITVVSF
jgi:hypothetical protein